jgi:hydroxymethylglutaryl-CoA reductase
MSHSKLVNFPTRRNASLSGLHRDPPSKRRERLIEAGWLEPTDAQTVSSACGFGEACADSMVENVIGIHGLPLAVATNFIINGRPRILPMAVEEPSIVAACSYAARIVSAGGGFSVEADPPIIAAQIQLKHISDLAAAMSRLNQNSEEIVRRANNLIPRMVQRGGGAKDTEVRILDAGMLCVHIHVDCRDAMGANTVNTVAEGLSPFLCELAGAQPGLRILSNYCDRRRVRVRVSIPCEALASEALPDGERVRDGIVEAQTFAELDPYRAVTHNKGVMNGLDAVLVACGNDWRAVESGAHAWAARTGQYRPLTTWTVSSSGDLEGSLELPLAASIVGGAAGVHPGVQLALRMAQATSATDLAGLAASAGLASNLAALKALSTEGIQRGHMALHARRLAAEAGASGEWVDLVAAQLAHEKVFRAERATQVLNELRAQRSLP